MRGGADPRDVEAAGVQGRDPISGLSLNAFAPVASWISHQGASR
jgi:hypothetical protein